jgi:diguanylate cyclase (GGDEF)-like protein
MKENVADDQRQGAMKNLEEHLTTPLSGIHNTREIIKNGFLSWTDQLSDDFVEWDEALFRQLLKEAKSNANLFQIAKNLHSKIDVESVLEEVIRSVKNVRSDVEIDLFLSQEIHNTGLPVQPLFFHNRDDFCTRAFMEGKIFGQCDIPGIEDKYHRIAAPLCGKQGIYGVLKIQSTSYLFDESEVHFISLLADTAGIAFENARLYEQSNLLISELRLINEITKHLNQSLKLNDIFNFASSELIKIFGAEYCCVLQRDKEKEQLIVQSSNLPTLSHDSFALDYGFSGIVLSTKEPVIISDYSNNPKVKSKLMEITNSRSLIASPIFVNSEVEGVILVTHRKPNFFSYENYKLLQVLSGHIGLAITNASLHAAVKRMVITDNLTGLYARHYLDEQINFLQKKDFCGSLIVTDIDNFKRVNDTYGHQVGDQILTQVSKIIASSIRDSDIAARWGGEELAIYLPQATVEQTVRVAERIRNTIAKETNPQVTVSCGIAEWHWQDDKISVESLFYRADMALYEAKHAGKNQIRIGTN